MTDPWRHAGHSRTTTTRTDEGRVRNRTHRTAGEGGGGGGIRTTQVCTQQTVSGWARMITCSESPLCEAVASSSSSVAAAVGRQESIRLSRQAEDRDQDAGHARASEAQWRRHTIIYACCPHLCECASVFSASVVCGLPSAACRVGEVLSGSLVAGPTAAASRLAVRPPTCTNSLESRSARHNGTLHMITGTRTSQEVAGAWDNRIARGKYLAWCDFD